MSTTPDPGERQSPGSRHYRAWIGATQTYDIFSHMQFSLMTLLGMRQEHTLLDIGCGSLRAGKLFIVYLLPERYFGIEPEQWLVEEGLERELGAELAAKKKPRFLYTSEFSCTEFGVQFDFAIAQSIFSHASVAQIRRCLSQVRQCLKPGALFAASFVEGDEDYDGEAWVYPETIRYRAATMERLAAEAGLECRRVEWFHIGGQTWFVFYLPGSAPDVEPLATLNQIAPLKVEMTHYKMRSDRLEKIEKHPLFRIAARLRRLLRR
jgi:SAM-dependent methyltransferase